MAHQVFGNRFMDSRRPAWHGLGIVRTEPTTAVEGLELIGEHVVETVQLQTIDGLAVDQYAIIRRATLMFITTKLPTIDVKGDEVEMYLIARNGMDGKRVAGCDISPVRVVCQNTLSMSERMATDSFRVVHDKDAIKRLGLWMHQSYVAAEARVAAIKDAFTLLSEHRVTSDEQAAVIDRAYPLRSAPRRDVPSAEYQQRVERWQHDVELVKTKRVAAAELFAGAGTGMSHVSAAGTTWGLYNAVVETEDYRRGPTGVVDADALFGNRAATKARAFANCVIVAKGGELAPVRTSAHELTSV
jgi:hypothetical protein